MSLIGALEPLAFKVIIDMYIFIAILLLITMSLWVLLLLLLTSFKPQQSYSE